MTWKFIVYGAFFLCAFLTGDAMCQWSSKIEPHGRAKLNHLE